MQILLGMIIGAVIGLAVHYTLPGKQTRGVALAPIVGAAVGAVVWTILTWAGFAPDNPWIWVAALVAPIVVTVPIVSATTAFRGRRDEAERVRLRIG